jgi:hypothetical protein
VKAIKESIRKNLFLLINSKLVILLLIVALFLLTIAAKDIIGKTLVP